MTDYLIFVDANIYLECYNLNYSNYRELLNFVISNKQSVLYTQMVRDEFRRRRAKTYLEKNIKDKPEFYAETIRSHDLWENQDDAGGELRILREEIKQKVEVFNKRFIEIKATNFTKIAHGEDDVSNILRNLDSQIVKPTDDQLYRARLRKELGNPPGKSNGPLGDQLSWEQILDGAKGKRAVWIVSSDGDYYDEWNKQFYLKSILADELREQSGVNEIYCHKTLPSFFKEFSKSGYGNLVLPGEAVISEAQREVTSAASEADVEWYNRLRYLKSSLPEALSRAEAELAVMNKKLECAGDPGNPIFEGESLQYPYFKNLHWSIQYKTNEIRMLKLSESFDGHSMDSAQSLFHQFYAYG